MRSYPAPFSAALAAARDDGIAPVYFFWAKPRDRATGAETPMGFWTGDEDVTLNVPVPDGGGQVRTYIGGCGLHIEGMSRVGDLTDNPVTVSMSQIAGPAQWLARGLDPRLAYVEIHATCMIGGSFASDPQIEWVGIIDEGPISTPSEGGDGAISYTVRSELMVMLTQINPAKSSDAHQKRRAAGDEFCKYAGIVGHRTVQGYKRG